MSRGNPNSSVFNWLQDIDEIREIHNDEINSIEVRFKQDRKEIYINPDNIKLKKGDIVAVESSQGHDVGMVSLLGKLVLMQIKRKKINPKKEKINKIYRIAKPSDINRWKEAISKEKETLEKAKSIVIEHKLEMKLSNVEYQGDNTKATFYYTAEKRVDFRELIKSFSKEFKLKIQMRQIRTRQESAKLGGIGTCGRELCCSSWMTEFPSVSISSARDQNLSINLQKLTGQCGRLKCCLNFELQGYLDEIKIFPSIKTELKTKKDSARFLKMDIYKKKMWYTYNKDPLSVFELIVNQVNKIITLNNKGVLPQNIEDFTKQKNTKGNDFENFIESDDIARFDNRKNKTINKKQKSNKKRKIK